MKRIVKHMNRRELISAARGEDTPWRDHLKACPECRQAVELLREYRLAGAMSLPDAPSGWVEKATALARVSHPFERMKRLVARLVFDSWTAPLPVGVRGPTGAEHRRLRFESAGINIDFRAERVGRDWHFVAAIGGEKIESTALRVAGNDYFPDEDGLIQWEGSRPPRRIQVLTPDCIIEMPELTWKKPKK